MKKKVLAIAIVVLLVTVGLLQLSNEGKTIKIDSKTNNLRIRCLNSGISLF